ncbi:23S rRNA (guanosine(2251)-2'-O)-methyltransferase RlmB [Thiorhodospira sibirica]|uniref:23S rRNA (guanosine(2251)-2'-O)-methyltransferase RlmB n=1 Tax=Thiorhodospira sibirica TaxID=154347 RepID=UPI00022C4C79|nr:23S rRNA (guanosine(2251)-2'-O)-methyltransferase RlmB [Thiorhodospira sibirica]
MSASHDVFGWHAVLALLQHEPLRIKTLLADQQRQDQRVKALIEAAKTAGVQIQWVNRKTLDKRCPGGVHQGVMAQCRAPERDHALAWSEGDLLDAVSHQSAPLLLVLDGLTDPHNLGACLRTAEAAGVMAVIIPRNRAVGLTPVVRKVACGAAEIVPLVQVTNLARTLKALKEAGVWIVGTAGEAPASLYATPLDGPLALVMGAEGQGARRLTQEACDVLVHIPMLGQVESLNVSVATGVCLYEALRQRHTQARTA